MSQTLSAEVQAAIPGTANTQAFSNQFSWIEKLIQKYIPAELQPVYESINTISLYENSVGRIVLAVVLGLIGYFFIPRIWARIVESIGVVARRTELAFDDLLVEQLRKINPKIFLLLAILLGLSVLRLPGDSYQLAAGVVFGLLTLQFATILQPLIEPIIKSIPPLGRPDMKPIAARVIVFAKTALWGIAGIFSLSSVGVSVTPLLGSLGVLWVGWALAFQQMIPGVMKSLGFHFSKPFGIGDKISAGNHQGIVEEIDITTTKLKKDDGTLVDVPNEALMTAIVIPPDGPHFIEDSLKVLIKITNTGEAFSDLENILKSALDGIPDVTWNSMRFADFRGDAVVVDMTYSVLAEKKSVARHAVVAGVLTTLNARGIAFGGV